jgi:hypothetical protein
MKYGDFLDGDDVFPVSRKFVEEEVVPRVTKVLEDFGDGWLDTDLSPEIHTREIAALLAYIEGRCKG